MRNNSQISNKKIIIVMCSLQHQVQTNNKIQTKFKTSKLTEQVKAKLV